jgi:hypothetical protein
MKKDLALIMLYLIDFNVSLLSQPLFLYDLEAFFMAIY